MYGWYDSPAQPCEEPSYDPPLDFPCPHCGWPGHADDARTYMCSTPGGARPYFFRVHRSCAEAASEQETESLFQALADRIRHNGD